MSSPVPAPPLSPDHARHLLERFRWKDRSHLPVTGLVPTDTGDRPDLGEEAWVGGVHGEVLSVEPLDLSIAPGDGRVSFGIRDYAESQRASEVTKVRECARLARHGLTSELWSRIYHRLDCPNYGDVAQNRVPFGSAAEAESAGYWLARNCP